MKKLKTFLAFAILFALLSSLMAANVAAAYVQPPSITIKYANMPPAIDGALSTDEWGDPVWSFAYSDGTDLGDYGDQASEGWLFYNGDMSEADLIAFLKKTKIEVFAMWDETYLYFAMQTDNPMRFFPGAMEENDIANSWNSRCIQFEYNDKNGTFNDIGFSIDDAGNSVQYWWMGENAGTVMHHSYKAVKSGTAAKYEVALKWEDLNLNPPKAGQSFPFTLCFNFHDVYDGGPFFGLSLGRSEMTKNPDVFEPVTLSGDPAIILPPPPETEAPAETLPMPEPEPQPQPEPVPVAPPAETPKTGDVGVSLFVLVAFGAAFAIGKKAAVK